MKQAGIIVSLGVIQMIILTIFGFYFYRLKHTTSQVAPPITSVDPQAEPTSPR